MTKATGKARPLPHGHNLTESVSPAALEGIVFVSRVLRALRTGLTWAVVTGFLVVGSLLVPAPADATGTTYTVTGSTINVRASKSTGAAVLGSLAKGAHVLAAGKKAGDWLPIRYASRTAYVHADGVKADKKDAGLVVTGPAGKKTSLSKVRARTGPSLSAGVDTIVAKGTVVRVTGETTGTFSKVRLKNTTRWMSTALLSRTTDTTPDTVANYTTTTSLALRAAAGVAAASLRTVKVGATVGGTGVHSAGYSQVVASGRTGWVITGYLKAAKGTAARYVLPLRKTTRYVSTARTALRSAASAKAKQVASLDKAFALRTTGTVKARFTQVIWTGSTAWIATGALARKQPIVVSAATTPAVPSDLGSTSLNKLQAYGKVAVVLVRQNFPQITTIYGWRSSSAYSSDHPKGRAVDFMIPSYKTNKGLGDKVAAYFISNGKALHVNYIIWRQRSYTLSGGVWKKMADRGGDTANHYDHVHVSFFNV